MKLKKRTHNNPLFERSQPFTQNDGATKGYIAAGEIETITMQQIYVSNEGSDDNDGLSPDAPIKSLKRLYAFWSDHELVLMEGGDTLIRLVDEMVVSVKARA